MIINFVKGDDQQLSWTTFYFINILKSNFDKS